MQHELLDTDTLALLRDSLERYGREQYGFERRRQRLAQGFDRATWKDYAALGWLAMPLPCEDGGFASAPQAVGALMEYAGRTLALEPLFASVVLCGRLLGLAGADPVARAELQALADGSVIHALAHAEDAADGMQGEVAAQQRGGRLSGQKLAVLHGDRADRLLVTARDAAGSLGVYVVEANAPQVETHAFRLVDGRGAANVRFMDAPAARIGGGDAAHWLARTLDEARLALCAEALGSSQALNALTLAWLKERRQFGRPIGTNQALQHRMVELYMLEQEGRAVLNAAWRAAPQARRAASCAALAHMITLGRQASHEAVQMHGGIGVTEELAVSHYFRRILVLNRLLGDRDQHLRQFAEASLPDRIHR